MRCPRCKEEIIGEDVTECKLCGETISSQERAKWYFRSSAVFIGFLLTGPFVLPLVWYNPNYKFTTKVILTILIIVVTIFLLAFFIESLRTVVAYYKQLMGVL